MRLLRAVWRLLPRRAQGALHRRAARLVLDQVHAAVAWCTDGGVDSRVVLEAVYHLGGRQAFLDFLSFIMVAHHLKSGATARDAVLLDSMQVVADAHRTSVN